MARLLKFDQLNSLDLFRLLDHFESLMAPYDRKADENKEEARERMSAIIAQLPDIYTWANTVWSYYDWLTDRFKELHGQSSLMYKEARQRRDATEKIASSIKLKYQGASREITIVLGDEEETRMPRSR